MHRPGRVRGAPAARGRAYLVPLFIATFAFILWLDGGFANGIAATSESPSTELPSSNLALNPPGARLPIPPSFGFGPPPPSANPTSVKPKYALLLPLSSLPFTRAAAAVKQGFLVAAEAAGERGLVTIVPHGDADVIAAYTQAASSGAGLVVGPLARDHLGQLVEASSISVTTLALNELQDQERPPANLYTFGLSIESEGRQLARLIYTGGLHRIAVIADTSPLQRRLQQAFIQEWERQGASVVALFPYESDPATLRKLKIELSKSKPDCLLLALDNKQAREVRAYMTELPAFASSLVFDGLESPGYYELNNVKFLEMPWLAEPDHAAVMVYRRGEFHDVALERLYALGIDAFRLAQILVPGRVAEDLDLDGVTGRISVSAPQKFLREGILVKIREGHIFLDDSLP